MKINKLKEFLSVADKLSDEVKDMEVHMPSGQKPTDKVCGCHAGLVSIIAKDLPELQEFYNNHVDYKENEYRYENWADALALFLGFKSKIYLEEWAMENSKIWGNNQGYIMFICSSAFDTDFDLEIDHRSIINHWHQVVFNIENRGKK